MVMFCRPVSALLPPTSSITAATPPVATPQKMTLRRPGSSVPRCESVPMTIEAASAPETKKMPTSSITTMVVRPAQGIVSSSPNN